MSHKPLVPDSLPIRQVLAHNEPLQRLQQRVKASNERLNAVRGCLPVPLLLHIKAGPLDDDHWTILVSNQAVAAKLRHFQPHIEAALQSQGWGPCILRIKVQPS